MSPLNELTRNIQRFAESVASQEKYDIGSHVPSAPDVILDSAWASIERLSNAEVDEIREAIDAELARKLLAYCRRAAVIGLRTSSSEPVRFGLYAISLDADLLDIRDVFRAVVLHFDVCRKYDFDFPSLFEVGLRFATERRRNQIAGQFLRGPNYTKSLKAMKYTVVETDDGLSYVDGLFSWP